MSELIIHSEAEEARQIAYEEGFHDGYRQAMSEMPNVVRCKDCKHWEDSFSNGKYRFGMCGKTFGMIYTPEIHFCYDGERKEQTDG